jgi:predicted GIY-YIG superfamily endonuclease
MSKPFWMYILKCADGSFYTGHTDDLEKRLGQHDEAMFPDCYTVDKRPLELFYAEECQTREDAKQREYQVKSWSRAKKIALAKQDWDKLKYFARPPSERHPSAALGAIGYLKPMSASEVEGERG